MGLIMTFSLWGSKRRRAEPEGRPLALRARLYGAETTYAHLLGSSSAGCVPGFFGRPGFQWQVGHHHAYSAAAARLVAGIDGGRDAAGRREIRERFWRRHEQDRQDRGGERRAAFHHQRSERAGKGRSEERRVGKEGRS